MIMHRYCDSKMNKITMRTVIRERKFKRVTRINEIATENKNEGVINAK